MIIKILSEKDFLDLLCGDWEFTDEAKKALYKHLNNVLIFSVCSHLPYSSSILKVFNHHATALAM
jgi:hypothetical protein